MKRLVRSTALHRMHDDERGDFAVFIAVIAAALLLFGSIAYDAPRLISARQHAVHVANEAAGIAAATVAAGGLVGLECKSDPRTQSPSDVCKAALSVVDGTLPPYGANFEVVSLRCTGNRVEVTIETWYSNRSPLGVFRDRVPIAATGAAQAVMTGPDGKPATLKNLLPECLLVQPSP